MHQVDAISLIVHENIKLQRKWGILTIHGKLELLVLVNKIKEYPYESEFSMFE